ncbi:MAG: DUF4390 domain-containing protein [Vicinamibacteraceae bacterium]
MIFGRPAFARRSQSVDWRRRAWLAGLLCGLAGGLAPAAVAGQALATETAGEDTITVAPLARGESILVSFSTARAVTPAVEQAIANGMPTTFTYDVELRRPSAFWFDKLVASARVAVTVRFEPVTRRYHVTLLQDGRVAEARATGHVEDVRRWVSTFERLPLFTTRELQEQTTYDVRVRGRTSPRHTWSFWPWARPSAHGSAGFTFVP